MIAATGWTWDEVTQNVDIPRLTALRKQWNRFPPVHQLIAAYMGVKPTDLPADTGEQDLESQEAIPVNRVSEETFNELLKQAGLPIQ